MKYLAILVLLPLAAYATDTKPPSQEQAQDQRQEQSQSQQQSQSAEQANSQSVSFEDRRQAPSAFAPSIAPTAPCYYSASGGLSLPGFGASGGKAIKDDACELRENIRLAYALGLVPEADFLFCSTIGKDIPNCGKRPVPVCDQKPCITQDDLAERWQRIQEKSK